MITPKLKDSSSTTLLVLSALLLIPGILILTPDGRLFFLVLAGLASAVVAIAGPSRKKRIAAFIGLLLVAALAIPMWPESRSHFDSWKKHTSRPVEQKGK
jgi:membrane protein implicated in regulation of membrane protease activity